jgi:hypothetical protein
MGESLTNMLGSLTAGISLDSLLASASGLIDLLPDPVKDLYTANKTTCLLALACLLALFAFEGYKIFKMLLFAGSAFGFAYIGLNFIAPVIPAEVRTMIPDIVEFDVLVAVICALLAVFICKCAYTLMIMILGGVTGYLVGANLVYPVLIDYFNTLEFLRMDAVKHIVGGAIAAVMVLLFILFFKNVYIVGTSFGGAIASALVVQSTLIPTADDSVKICFILVGLALGIFAVVRQYREEEKAMEIVF